MRLLTIALATCLPLLFACQTPATQPLPDPLADQVSASASALGVEYGELVKLGEGTVYALDPAVSKVRIYVFRGGAAARAGHNHVFAASTFEGNAYVHPSGVSKSRFDVRVRLDQLLVDDPAWRTETGGAFVGERSAADIEGTLRNMLGARGLDAQQFPVMRLKSVSIAGDWPLLMAETAITLRNVTLSQNVLLTVRSDASQLTASGTMVIRQSDFGIAPFTVLGGLLAVQDAVAVSFELTGRAVK